MDTAVRYEDDIENLRVWNVTMGGQVGSAFQEASSDQSVLDVRNFLILSGSLPAEAQGIASNLAVDAASFVDAAGHDYHLAAGSPAIEAGETIAEVATDRDSVLRPQDDSYEVGAYEYCPNGCQPTYVDGGIPASDSGIPHVDSGVPSADSGNGGGGTSRSGCGCRAGRGGPAAPWVAIFLLVLGLLARHRSVSRKVGFVTILDPKRKSP